MTLVLDFPTRIELQVRTFTRIVPDANCVVNDTVLFADPLPWFESTRSKGPFCVTLVLESTKTPVVRFVPNPADHAKDRARLSLAR